MQDAQVLRKQRRFNCVYILEEVTNIYLEDAPASPSRLSKGRESPDVKKTEGDEEKKDGDKDDEEATEKGKES